MLQDTLDQIPRERPGFVRQACPKRAALPGLFGIGAIEVDLEERLEREAPRGMATAARRLLAHAADATPSMPFARTLPVKPSVTQISVMPRVTSRPSMLP